MQMAHSLEYELRDLNQDETKERLFLAEKRPLGREGHP